MTTCPEEPPEGARGPRPAIKVYLLMESRLSREALARILHRFPDVTVVGEGAQPEQARSLMATAMCDLLILDTSEPGWLGSHLGPGGCAPAELKILLIGMDSDADQFLNAVRSGVSGYLLKDASASEILVAIRALGRGEVHCPPQLCLKLFQYVAQQDRRIHSEPAPGLPSLTLRQEKLVNLVARGLTNKEIATELNLSEFTIRNHMHRIMRRLKATNRREVVDAVQAHERERLQVSARGKVSPKNPDVGILFRNVQPQWAQPRFRAIRHSTIPSLRYEEGAVSENRQCKGE
jgi:DNA-binding NarL/FixJ family response regulator